MLWLVEAQRYAHDVIDVLRDDFPALREDYFAREAVRDIASHAYCPAPSFEMIVTYTREWRLMREQTGTDRWRVQIICRRDNPTAEDAEREQRINAALRAIDIR